MGHSLYVNGVSSYDSSDPLGSKNGLEQLEQGNAEIAAISEPLDIQTSNKYQSLRVASVPIAVYLGKDNAFKGRLSTEDFRKIMSGSVFNWSEVGGKPQDLVVFDRNENSGTRESLRSELFKDDGEFGKPAPNYRISLTDQTTDTVRTIGTIGISYASFGDVCIHNSIRLIPIDGRKLDNAQYPFHQPFYYVYREKAVTPETQAFLDYVRSPEGQEIINKAIEEINTQCQKRY